MFVIVVMAAPLLAGMLLILFIARFAPNVPREPSPLGPGGAGDDRPEITGDEFRDLIDELCGALGMSTVFSSVGTGGVVEMTLRDPRPLSGGRIVLQATPVLSEQVDSVDALGFAESVRADMGCLKGILISLAGFTDEARTGIGSSPAPVDLIDGGQLLDLVREHLGPERAELCASYRGFGSPRLGRSAVLG